MKLEINVPVSGLDLASLLNGEQMREHFAKLPSGQWVSHEFLKRVTDLCLNERDIDEIKTWDVRDIAYLVNGWWPAE